MIRANSPKKNLNFLPDPNSAGSSRVERKQQQASRRSLGKPTGTNLERADEHPSHLAGNTAADLGERWLERALTLELRLAIAQICEGWLSPK